MSISFYRKMAAFLEEGYKTCRQMLINWMSKEGGHLKQVLLHIFFFDEGSRGRKVLSEFLGDAEIKALQSDAYNAYYYLDNEECGIEHLCCLAHARAKFFQAWKQGQCEEALFYLDKIEALYNLERLYKERGLTPDQIKDGRNSAETIEIVADIRQRLTQHLKDGKEKSEQFQKALNYMDNYWTQLMAFRNDGRYEINNSIAERAIRTMTVEPLFYYYRELLTAVASDSNDYEISINESRVKLA